MAGNGRPTGEATPDGATPDGAILVLNAGSSSLKLGLFAPGGERRLGEDGTSWEAGTGDGKRHRAAVRELLGRVDLANVGGVGHRVVHGGDRFTAAVVIGEAVRRGIADLAPLAPLHNPAALAAIEAVGEALPGVPQVAVFDTAFHATIAPARHRFALPEAWHARWGLRRFGFHGLSHAYCADQAAALLRRPAVDLRLVTCHLGAGCSLAAVAGGRSIATTMGFTPLDGLVMATRPGAVDPGLLLHLLASGRIDLAELDDALNHRSGLAGLAGGSGDMREVLAARAAGDAPAALAFDVYVARLVEGIGAMAAALGGLDALVFTAGVGEHAAEVRAAACAPLGWFGIELDQAANVAAAPDADIATSGSPVRVLVIRTREDLVVARETRRLTHG